MDCSCEQPAARTIEDTIRYYGWTRSVIFMHVARGDLESVMAGRRITITTASADGSLDAIAGPLNLVQAVLDWIAGKVVAA